MAEIKNYDVGKPFQRTGKFPLDVSSIFFSFDDAEKYAECGKTGIIKDSRRLGKTAYQGQIISVVENGSVKIYKIDYNWALKYIGEGSGEGGETTFDIVDDDGNIIVNAGTPITDALQIIFSTLDEKMKEAGKVKDVEIDNVSILDNEGKANIVFTHDDCISISIKDKNNIDISLKGIFNEEIEIS